MKWGFEYGLGGNKSGTAEFRNRLTAANIGQCYKGTDDAGLVYEAQENGHPDSVLIYRVSTAGQQDGNDYDTPFYQLHPKDAAAVHYGITTNKWPRELDPNRVYQEPINEPRAKPDLNKPNYQNMHPCDWLGEFMTEYAILANADGRKVCGPCFNSGEPEPADYGQPGMLRWLNYCADNPEKAALSVHEYNFGSVPYADNYPWHYGRFQAAIAAADKAGIPRTFRIFITEWGWTLNTVPSWETAVPTIAAYSLLSARFPQLEAAAIWSLRAGWGGISDQLAAYISDNGNPFANWLINNQYPTETQPQATAPEFGSTLPAPPDNGGNDMAVWKNAIRHHITKLDVTEVKIAQFIEQTITGADGKQYLYHKLVKISDAIELEPGVDIVTLVEFSPEDEPTNPNPPPVELTLPQGSKGVDLSNYQAGFFDLVDPDDFDFYIFRCSDGMNTSATSQNHDANGVDLSLWKFADAGHASGKPWGIYHFLRPGNVEAQISKVRFIYQQLIARGTPPRTAVFDDGTPFTAAWCDFEDWNVSNAQVKQFCEGVDIATLTGIYSGQSIWNSKAAGVSIWWSDRPCWFADYGTNNGTIPNRNPLLLNGFNAGHIWQFSSQYGNEAGWKNDSLDINVVGPYYPENKPDPPTPPPPTGKTVDVLPWIRGPHRRQFDKEYKLSNGTTGTQTTQVFWLNEAGTDWLYIKGENGEYEHLGIRQWNGQPWVFRFEDTSEGPDRWYSHFMSDGGAVGAPWLPQFCEVEKWYETAKFVQHYSKDGTGKPICTKLNSGSVVDRLRIISEPYSRLYQSGKTEQVITAEWSAGEQYDFAGGNIAFRNSAGDNYWFMTWLEGRADKMYKKVECLNVGW